MLSCARCGSTSIVPDFEYIVGQGWTSQPKCMKCGCKRFVQGEGTVRKEAQQEQTAGTSPLTVFEKEEPMAKKCSVSGCDKKSWLKGLCYKHYREKYGEYVPEKKGNGVVLPKAAHNKATEEFAYPVRPAEPIPPIQLFLYPELLDKLTKAAKKEWRTPEGQAAYLIEKALEAGK